MSEKKLMRIKEEAMLLGVAGGVAEYFEIDPVLVRLGFVFLLAVSHGQFFWFYLLLAILMPKVGEE